ncbi:2-C-methyl-D-erythritol 2,4-cyclodiphosphate synthase [Alterileibacterium massiliense]|uniref:2-C-methyl-D-erythritol 2,4-cyclodiphosphate synthase n=1 Tax=Alterileibacterium massiliense TaxID=1870997 RepID=UPI00107FD3C5
MPVTTRVGIGYDVHKFDRDRRLILCGVEIQSEMGLDGHSDADVATHALIDAMLGAGSKGDIGKHFPDTDERYKDASSIELLKETMEIIDIANIVNVDLTIIAEKPKLAPYIEDMRKSLVSALEVDINAVNVKATTTEGLGFTGRKEGIAAMAICSIEGRF